MKLTSNVFLKIFSGILVVCIALSRLYPNLLNFRSDLFGGISPIVPLVLLFVFISLIVGALSRPKGSRLYALIGVGVTIFILGSVLYPVLAPRIFPNAAQKITSAKSMIAIDQSLISLYKEQHGKLPAKLSDIDLAENPYLSLTDPWGTTLLYQSHSNGTFELRSAGPDKVFHTNDDLTN
jgi:hypothetical protein